jgi:hypothetical protein
MRVTRDELTLVIAFLDRAEERISERRTNNPAFRGASKGTSPQNPAPLPPQPQVGTWYTLGSEGMSAAIWVAGNSGGGPLVTAGAVPCGRRRLLGDDPMAA